MVEAIKNIETSIGRVADKIGVAADATNKAVRATNDGLGNIKERFDDTAESLEEWATKGDEMFDSWEKHVQSFTNMLRPLTDELDKIKDKLGKLSIRDIMQGAGRGAMSLANISEGSAASMVGKIPYVGPFLELALDSQFREDKFRKQGRQAALQFEQTGQVGPEQIKTMGNALGGEMKRLQESFLASPDQVKAVWAAFAEGGVKVSEITKKAGFEIKGFGDTVSQVSLGIDKSFQMVEGSAAQMASQLTKDSGGALEKNVKLIQELGLAAHNTGQTSQQFINTILQLTSTMRVQGGDARDLAAAYLNIADAYRKTLPGPDDESKKLRAGTLAQQAVSSIPQLLQGLSVGVKATIGRALMPDGTNGIRSFEQGLTREGGDRTHFEMRALKELYEMYTRTASKENSVAGIDSRYTALREGANIPPELAEYLAKNNPKDLGKGFEAAVKEFKDNAASLEVQKIGELEKVMQEIKNAMMAIGKLTIGLMGTMVTILVEGFRYLSHPLTSGAEARFERAMNRVGKRDEANLKNVVRGAKAVGLDGLDTLGIGSDAFAPEREAAEDTRSQLQIWQDHATKEKQFQRESNARFANRFNLPIPGQTQSKATHQIVSDGEHQFDVTIKPRDTPKYPSASIFGPGTTH